MPNSIVAAGQACLMQQGIPDRVIVKTFVTNNTDTAATFHPFLNALVKRGSGLVLGIGSVNGIRGFPGHGANRPSKAVMISYCERLRGELRNSGVNVVTLCPGLY